MFKIKISRSCVLITQQTNPKHSSFKQWWHLFCFLIDGFGRDSCLCNICCPLGPLEGIVWRLARSRVWWLILILCGISAVLRLDRHHEGFPCGCLTSSQYGGRLQGSASQEDQEEMYCLCLRSHMKSLLLQPQANPYSKGGDTGSWGYVHINCKKSMWHGYTAAIMLEKNTTHCK